MEPNSPQTRGGGMVDPETGALIALLTADLRPVRPLAPPLVQAATWSFGACMALVLVNAVLPSQLHDPIGYLIASGQLPQAVAAGATALLAAYACFALARPERPGSVLLLPALGLLAWFACLGVGIVQEVRAGRADALVLGTSWGCMRYVTLAGVPLALVALWAGRHGLVLRPLRVVGCATLAGTSAASVALSCSHHLDTMLMVALWHVASVLLVTALAGLLYRPIARGLAPALA